MLDRIFKLTRNGTNISREVIAGLTTFMTMAYVLAVVPSVLSNTGMDSGAVFTATAISSFLACLIMGLVANIPVALAPGLGINAFFAYTIVLQMGYSWEMALAAVFIEGIIFIVLSIFSIRDLILKSIPLVLKRAIGVGIGLFIAIIGLVNSGVIVRGSVLSQLGDITQPQATLTLISILIIGVLMVKKVKGALIIGMLATTVIAIVMGVVTIPDNFSPFSMPHSIEPVFMKMDFSNIFSSEMLIIIFILLFAGIFDTAGTLFAVCSNSGLVDKEGNILCAKRAFFSDAIATTIGAIMGTSSVTSYVESSSGVATGGRTGLTAITTGTLFLFALFISPIITLIPTAATSGVLVIVGLLMVASVTDIDFSNYKDSLPAFITIIFTPFTYSIADGIAFGFISYVMIRILTGRFSDLNPFMYILTMLFISKLIFN